MKREDNPEDHNRPLYFGCWNSVGHGFHTPTGKNVDFIKDPNQEGIKPGRIRMIGPPTPWGFEVESLSPNSGVQGKSALHYKEKADVIWTALAVDDYTVDARPNSKSIFLFPEKLTVTDVLVEALDVFPLIMLRIGNISIYKEF